MLDDRLEGVLSESRLPTLPAVARRILTLAERGDTTVSQIAEAVELDQALVVRLLRTVNSSYYALPRPCASIPQAATLLGLRAVRAIVLGFSLARTIDGGDDREIDFPWRRYWRRSVRNAVAARLLARFGQGVDPDEAQLVGLLSEIGMVSMYRAFGDRYLQVKDEARGDHTRLSLDERRNFDVDHSEVGSIMAQRWGLPPEVSQAIAAHEREPSESMSPLERVSAMAGLAERATAGPEVRSRAAAEAAFHRTGERLLTMRSADAARLLESISRRAVELASMLEIDIGGAGDGEQLIDRARALQDPQAREAEAATEAAGERQAFDRRLTELFAAEARGTAVMVVEPDGLAGTRRSDAESLAMARLEVRLAESAGAGATVHRLTPTLFAVVTAVPSGPGGAREAMKIAERLRQDAGSGGAAARGRPGATATIGVAVHGANRFESPDAMLRAAMLALGAAQRGGRNRVGLFRPAHDPMTTASRLR